MFFCDHNLSLFCVYLHTTVACLITNSYKYSSVLAINTMSSANLTLLLITYQLENIDMFQQFVSKYWLEDRLSTHKA